MEVLHHNVHISGIVENGKGGRKFIPIDTMDDIGGTPGKASVFYLKTDDLQNQDLLRKEILATPGMQEYAVQTLGEFLSTPPPANLPAFNIGLPIVTAIA